MKKNTLKFIVFLYTAMLLPFLTSCGSGDENNALFGKLDNKAKDLSINILSLESFELDTLQYALTSSNIVGDRVVVVDLMSSFLYTFDKDLNLESRKLGSGGASNEIPLQFIVTYCLSHNGNYFFVDTNNHLFVYDSNCMKVDAFSFLNNHINSEADDVAQRYAFYVLNYSDPIVKEYDNKLFFSVAGGDASYNISNVDYYKDTRIIMSVDAQDGSPEGLFGRMSPEAKYMSAFLTHQFDIDKDNGDFYISYQCDSLIYVYSKDYTPIKSFGYNGVGMNQDYAQLTIGPEYKDELQKEMESKGYYSSVAVVGDYVFRSYKTGGNDKADRLQIYRDEVLVGDVEVPVDFEVIGYIAPYYYSSVVVDMDSGKAELFRFKL